jgi:hypothetical protein
VDVTAPRGIEAIFWRLTQARRAARPPPVTPLPATSRGQRFNAGAAVIPANTLNFLPETSHDEVVFTAPAAGSYVISSTFLDDDTLTITLWISWTTAR